MNENNASASDHGVCYTGYSRRSPVAPWRKCHPVCSTWTNCPREQQYVAPRKWRARVARFGYPPGQFPSLQYDRRGSHARHFDLCHGTGRSSGYHRCLSGQRCCGCRAGGRNTHLQYAHPRNAETTGLGHRIRMSEHCHGKHRNLLAAYLRDAGILF